MTPRFCPEQKESCRGHSLRDSPCAPARGPKSPVVLVRCAGILAGKEGGKSASGRLCSQADVAVEGHASFYIPPWLV